MVDDPGTRARVVEKNHMLRRELALQLRVMSGWDMVEIVLVASLVVSFLAEVHMY
jgi:hypothetical protein